MALPLELGRNIVPQVMGRSAFLVRVGEDANVIEPDPADEVPKLGKIRIGLTGESDDECRAQRDVWDSDAYPIEQTLVGRAGPRPFHPLQDGVGGVLERQVDVFAYLVAFCQRGE